MYIGWTYEIDAEAEVIYTNVNPAGWAVDHTWTWGTLPYVNHVGRGRGTDFFCDFRFAKVLEIEDRDTTRCIPVTCKVRDVRYPQFMIYDQDTDDVCFDVGSIDYNPADLRCVHLKDVTMFESGEEFHMFFDIEKGRIHSKLFVKLERGSDSERKFLKLIYGRTYKDDKYLTAFMIENGASKVYVDVDPFKFTNGNKGTDNLKLMKQLVGYQRPTNKMVGVIFDNAIDGGDLSPQNDVSEVGTLGFLTAAFGELGTGWDIIHHNRLTEEQCANNPFWDQYDTFIYYDRGIITEELPDLGHVKRLAKLGTARLIILGDHTNARKLSFDVTKISRSENKVDLIGQIIDPTICDPHPVTNGITLVAGSCHTSYLNEKDFEEELDLILLTPEIICEPSVDDTIGIIRFKMIENDFDQPTRRNYIVTVYDSLGVEIGTPCSRHVAYIDIIDDETQETVDGSITVHNIHRINEPFTTYETLILRANTWYSWNNKLYTDVSSNKFIYKIGFENCGSGSRNVEADLMLMNESSGELIVQHFNGNTYPLSPANMSTYTTNATRIDDGRITYLPDFAVMSDMHNDQDWTIRFRVVDQSPCDGEPPAPITCSGYWELLSGVHTEITGFPNAITYGCNEFTGAFAVRNCGIEDDTDIEVFLKNPHNKGCTVSLISRNGLEHQQYLPARSEARISLRVPYPPWTDGLLFVTILNIELMCDINDVLPKIECAINIKSVGICSERPSGLVCNEINYNSVIMYHDVDVVRHNVVMQWISQGDTCPTYYSCSYIGADSLNLEKVKGDRVRYRVSLNFWTYTNDVYKLTGIRRTNSTSDTLLWTSPNTPSHWSTSYILTRSDPRLNGLVGDWFDEHFHICCDDDLVRPNYKFEAVFIRECFDGWDWYPCEVGEPEPPLPCITPSITYSGTRFAISGPSSSLIYYPTGAPQSRDVILGCIEPPANVGLIDLLTFRASVKFNPSIGWNSNRRTITYECDGRGWEFEVFMGTGASASSKDPHELTSLGKFSKGNPFHWSGVAHYSQYWSSYVPTDEVSSADYYIIRMRIVEPKYAETCTIKGLFKHERA